MTSRGTHYRPGKFHLFFGAQTLHEHQNFQTMRLSWVLLGHRTTALVILSSKSQIACTLLEKEHFLFPKNSALSPPGEINMSTINSLSRKKFYIVTTKHCKKMVLHAEHSKLSLTMYICAIQTNPHLLKKTFPLHNISK